MWILAKNAVSAVRIVGWIMLAMSWLLAVMYASVEWGRGAEPKLWIWLALGYAFSISFVLAPRWIAIIPGVLLYGVLHFVWALVSGNYPEGSTSVDIMSLICIGLIGLPLFYQLNQIDVRLVDRVL